MGGLEYHGSEETGLLRGRSHWKMSSLLSVWKGVWGGRCAPPPEGATSELMAAACGSSYLLQSPASPTNVVLIVS